MTRRGFNKGQNRGTAACVECGKLTWREYANNQCGLCTTCFDRAGWENEHNDRGHEDPRYGTPDENCPICKELAAGTAAKEASA
jgi:rubrerythrin